MQIHAGYMKYIKDNMQDVQKNIEEYNPRRKCNALVVFSLMI